MMGLGFICLVWGSVACENIERRSGRAAVAGSSNLDRPAPAIAQSSSPSSAPVAEPELEELAERLRNMVQEWRLGALETPRWQVFGHIKDADIAKSKQVYVLDSRYNVVRIVSSTGDYVGESGGPGRGPGEFLHPQALSADAGGNVFVVDASRRVTWLNDAATAGFGYRDSFRTDFLPQDLCLANRRLRILGFLPDDSTLLHEMTAEGAKIRSFGALADSENPLLRDRLSSGLIACDATWAGVIYAADAVGEVSYIEPTGDVLWRRSVPEFRRMTITENPDGSVTFSQPPAGYDIIVSVIAITERAVLVQVAHHNKESVAEKRDFATLRSFVFGLGTGASVFVGEGVPRLHAIKDNVAVGSVEDPLPAVVAYRMRD